MLFISAAWVQDQHAVPALGPRWRGIQAGTACSF